MSDILDNEKKQKALKLANSLTDNFNSKETKDFANNHINKEWYGDFILLYKMITDNEFKVSKNFYLAVAGALAYVILPVDVVPDFIPIVGWLDDIFVLRYIISSFKDEIESYKLFLRSRKV